MKKSDKDLANDIRQRANAANVSISQLCREAGVSRQWYCLLYTSDAADD